MLQTLIYGTLQISVTLPDTDQVVTKLTPCSPGDAGAVEKSWTGKCRRSQICVSSPVRTLNVTTKTTDVSAEELQEPPLVLNDFVRAIGSVKPSVAAEDTKRYIEWAEAAGSDV